MNFARTVVNTLSGKGAESLETITDPTEELSEGLKRKRDGLVKVKSENELKLSASTRKINDVKTSITYCDNEVNADYLHNELDNLEEVESSLKNSLKRMNREVSDIDRTLSNIQILSLNRASKEDENTQKAALIKIKNEIMNESGGLSTVDVCTEIANLVGDVNVRNKYWLESGAVENEQTIYGEA